MSISIKKNGIIFLGGTNINPNLILNGNLENGKLLNVSQRENSAYWGNWGSYTSNRSIEFIDKKYWLHFKWSNDTASSYGGFYQDNGLQGTYAQEIKPNTNYTVSGIWFATTSLKCCYWFHMRSTQGGANIKQFTKNFTVTPEKTQFSYTFNSGSNDTYTINRFNLMIGAYNTAATADVYVTNIKLEEGVIITPYIPNALDDCFVSNINGYIENNQSIFSFGKDYAVANNFYEI